MQVNRNMIVPILTFIFTFVLGGKTMAEPKSTTKTKIMILGVYHFDNPGLDVFKSSAFDHLSENAQKEIAVVNRQLVEFKPDKVFIEQDVTRQSTISERYRQYLKGEFDITNKANEIYQLGFKVAKNLKHKNIYTIDAPGIFPYEELLAGIKRYGLDNVTREIEDRTARYKKSDRADATRTVLERLVNTNRPKKILEYHEFYNDLAIQVISSTPTHKLEPKRESNNGVEQISVPLDPDYIGAELTAEWYKRNIKIYANLYKKVEHSKDKRVLLIIGAGHVRILKHLFEDNSKFELVDANSVLMLGR
jgi:Family of unknown function (DUF5694)